MSTKNTGKCPVCDWKITDNGVKVMAGEREVIVCCEECKEKVMQDSAGIEKTGSDG